MAPSAPELRALGLALVVSLVLWQLPFGGIVLYPFKLLATWMHETSHALVMIITGAGFDHMDVYRDGSGLAYARHGVGGAGKAVIAAAGYMGTPLFGAVLLVVGQEPRAARRSQALIGGLLLASVAVVTGRFGQIAVASTGAVALIAAMALPDRGAVMVANFVAAQACINAVVDIRVLYRPTLVVDGQTMGGSDAHTMAGATFGTTEPWAIWVWASVWLLWSLALFFAALALARRRRAAVAAAEPAPDEERPGERPATAP
jgi:hypothetical protein